MEKSATVACQALSPKLYFVAAQKHLTFFNQLRRVVFDFTLSSSLVTRVLQDSVCWKIVETITHSMTSQRPLWTKGLSSRLERGA
jgi:hypothetical protein